MKNERRLTEQANRQNRRATDVAKLLAASKSGTLSLKSKVDTILYYCGSTVQNFEEQREDFVRDLNGDAAHALDWGTDFVQSAQRADLAMRIGHAIMNQREKNEDDATIQKNLLEWVRREVICMARSPKQSTSGISNLCEQFKLAAYAELLERLEGGL